MRSWTNNDLKTYFEYHLYPRNKSYSHRNFQIFFYMTYDTKNTFYQVKNPVIEDFQKVNLFVFQHDKKQMI